MERFISLSIFTNIYNIDYNILFKYLEKWSVSLELFSTYMLDTHEDV